MSEANQGGEPIEVPTDWVREVAFAKKVFANPVPIFRFGRQQAKDFLAVHTLWKDFEGFFREQYQVLDTSEIDVDSDIKELLTNEEPAFAYFKALFSLAERAGYEREDFGVFMTVVTAFPDGEETDNVTRAFEAVYGTN